MDTVSIDLSARFGSWSAVAVEAGLRQERCAVSFGKRPSRRRYVAAGGLIAAFAFVVVMAGARAAPVAAPKTAAKKDDAFQTSIPAAILLDPESDSVLFDKNGDQPVAPASLAKLMTLEYLFNEIKQGRVKLDDQYTISENAWRKGGAPSHGSTMFAAINSRIKVSDLIQGIIVDSANDACIAVAEALGGNEAAFGAMLTKRAREIGLQNSTFTNATGYSDPNLRVTVRDMAELARHIMQTYPDFYPDFALRDFTWGNIRQQNRNPLLGMGIGADGLKTGETAEAGFNLVGSAVQDNFRLIVVVTGAKSDKERSEEARKLLDLGFHGFDAKVVFAEGQTIGEAKVFGGDRSYVTLIAPGTIKVMMPRNTTDRLLARIVYTGPVPAPITKGQTIGMLKVWRGDNLALEVPLQAADDVGPGSMSQRAMDGATELMIGLLRAGVNKL
jgi:serine-type D-Ala-D-Ala carboxypeptidase (penicillin-binding protein 5/6)